MKKLLFLTLLFCVRLGFSQGTVSHIRYGPTLPATCSALDGELFFKTTGTVGTYQCLTTNTWTQIGSGGGINATQVNGASVPASLSLAGTNSLGQIVAATTALPVAVPGIVCDGSTDNYSAFAAADAAGKNFVIPTGTGACMIKTNITLNATYWFTTGGSLGVSTGVTVAMNQQPLASVTQIFSLTGTGIVSFPNGATVYPEWWGATGNSSSYTDQTPFNAAVAAIASGTIVLTKPNYYGNGFVINKSYVSVHSPNGPEATYINSNSATATILSLAGTGANCTTGANWFNHLDGFSIKRTVAPTSGAKGLDLTDTCWPELHDFESWDSITDIYLNGTANLLAWNSQVGWTSTTGSGSVYGVNYDGTTVASDSNRLGPHFVVAAVGSSPTSYGLYAHGSYINDLFAYDFETAGTSYGEYFTSSSPGSIGNSDIHLIGNINDRCGVTCIYVNGLTANGLASLEVIGGWNSNNTAGSITSIDIESSTGVKIVGSTVGTSGTGFINKGVYINGGSANTVTAVQFANVTNPVVLNATTDNIITSNTISNYSSSPATTGIGLTGSSSNVISSNSLTGYGTTGVSLDATSNNNNVYPNDINTTHITTAISNSGTGNTTGGGGSGTVITVASGSLALATSSIGTNSCQTVTAGSVNSAAASGTLTTDTIQFIPNGSIKAVTGFVPSTSGGLTITAYPTAGYVNFDVCNWTGSSITPGAVTLNWKVMR